MYKIIDIPLQKSAWSTVAHTSNKHCLRSFTSWIGVC